MLDEAAARRALHLFAQILEYPRFDPAGAVRRCAALASVQTAEAGGLLDGFLSFVEATPPGRLQEVYSGVFDLDAACHPYVGYHLLGESYNRSLFMLGLKERYRADGFAPPPGDLPDHLTTVLRFAATSRDAPLVLEIVQDALLPALDQMLGKGAAPAEEADHSVANAGPAGPYHGVLHALRLVLRSLASEGQWPTAIADMPAD